MRKLEYSKEFCENEALKYERRINFQINSTSIYKFARKNKWLDDICSHMRAIKPNNYWSLNRCQEEALKYNKKEDFNENSRGAYSAARLNGWLNQICSHMVIFSKPHGYWTKEKCHFFALKYKTKKDFSENDKTAYKMAHKKGWIDEICIHMEILGNRYNRCIYSYEFSDNHVYVGLTCNMSQRDINRRFNKHDQVTKYIKKTELMPVRKRLTKYIPVKEASFLEKYYVEKYKNEGWIILNKIKTGGIGGGYIIWTHERVEEVALKYNKRTDFKKNNAGAYDAAWRNNWLDDVCSHMINGNQPKNNFYLQ